MSGTPGTYWPPSRDQEVTSSMPLTQPARRPVLSLPRKPETAAKATTAAPSAKPAKGGAPVRPLSAKKPHLSPEQHPIAAKAAKPGKAPVRPPAAKKPRLSPEQHAVQTQQEKREAKIARAAAINALRVDLQAAYPAAFPTPPVPLAIGIITPLLQAMRDRHTGLTIRRFLGFWTTRTAYQQALAAGEPRRNLDGSLAGEPTAADREAAVGRLARKSA